MARAIGHTASGPVLLIFSCCNNFLAIQLYYRAFSQNLLPLSDKSIVRQKLRVYSKVCGFCRIRIGVLPPQEVGRRVEIVSTGVLEDLPKSYCRI